MKIEYKLIFAMILVAQFNFWLGYYIAHKEQEELINQLEKEKFEYCEVIAKLEWYAPDSVKYKYKHIIEFAKLQEFGKCKN